MGITGENNHPGAGVVHFKIVGKNQRGEPVFEGERKVMIKKKRSRR
ncbi:MAG: hypothetical protein KKH04_12895 [Proteobacteria bacterium]|nr:hypothetical protein [Pseudomonadota bacterium]